MLKIVKSIYGPQSNVPQTQPLNKRQSLNSAGGYVYTISDFERFKRFLILGSSSGSYYISAKDLTKDNAECISRLLDNTDTDIKLVVDEIVSVSVAARAPKQSPGIFALAVCSRHPRSSSYSLKHVKEVCRTASTLFEFIDYLKLLGGISWGRAMRRTITDWYVSKKPLDLAYQITKYQSRNGWSHRDILRLTHPSPKHFTEVAVVFEKIMNDDVQFETRDGAAEQYFAAVQTIKATDDVEVAKRTLSKYPGKLSWEHVGRTELLKNPSIWGTILENGLPMTALVRNISRFSENGVLSVRKYADIIIRNVQDDELLKKSRIHPINLLQAHKMLMQKHPNESKVLQALDNGFYKAFGNIRPAGKRVLIGVDVSGSMGCSCSGMTCLSARDAAAAMTLMLVKSEPFVKTMAFAHHFQPLSITNMDTLTSVQRTMSGIPFGGTDCSLPIVYALENNLNVDCFCVLTDCETYAGRIHPTEAIRQYRQKINKNAKLAVLAFSSTNFSIADPQDKGMLDCAGMDASLPEILRQFMLDYED